MPRAKSPPRVKGPYSERGGTRFRIRICEPTGHRDLYFATRQAALAGMRQAAQELAPGLGSLLLGDVLDEFTAERVLRGGATEKTANESRARLRLWFAETLAEDVRKLTPRRATAMYERLVHTPSCKTGKPPTAATHRFYLLMARALFRWALKRGYVRENPFEGVQPVGRPAAGKKQLRFEEAERFISAGFRLFDERGDAMALAAVTALLLGCRASEVTHLRARDLDCGGTRLWIAACDGDYRGKTRNATRNSDVPDVLRPRLLKRVEGLRPDDYLFGATAAGKPRCRQLLYSAVHRVCAAAEVPRVCAHSLRGLWATAGVRSGALSHAVAAALGHGSFAMTARHYVRPGTIDGARTDGLMQILALKEGWPASDPARLSAEELLAALPTETLTRLLDLVRHSHSPRDTDPT